MPEITRSITLAAPVDKLWEKISNVQNFAEWMTIHNSFKGDVPSAEDLKPGTKYSEVVSIMGMANTIEWTILEASTAADVLASKKGSFKVTGTGMAGVQTTIEVAVDGTAGESTTVDLHSVFEGQMLVGAIGNAIDKAVGEELDASLEKLKAII